MGSFVIEELNRAATGDLLPTGVKFEWTAKEQTKPENEWAYSIGLVTVRDENPGNDRPTEQVLAPRFEDFTLQGKWDDRHAGAGFAEKTRRQMEEFIAGGGLARLSIDAVSVVGIVKKLDIRYRHKTMIRYAFTVSPHYRDDGVVRAAADALGAAVGMPAATAPDSFVDRAQAEVDIAQAYQDDYPIASTIQDTTAAEIGADVDGWQTSISSMRDVIDARLLQAEEQVNTTARLAAQFGALKTEAYDTLSRLRALNSDSTLAFSTATSVLDYEVWVRGLSASALRLILRSEEARRELFRRDRPHGIKTHRAKRGENLYSISQLYYHTPFRWLAIFERNNLASTELQGGELLVIPEGA